MARAANRIFGPPPDCGAYRCGYDQTNNKQSDALSDFIISDVTRRDMISTQLNEL